VDDEPPARRRLRQLLAVHPNVEVVGEATSVGEARLRLEQCRPDLALVDIQLRDAEAFELFGSAPLATAVVFVTAHAEHALRAFECDVIDYLLKPVRPERLAAALVRAERWRAARATGSAAFEGNATACDATAQSPTARGPCLALYNRRELRIVPRDTILHIVARDDHSELYLRDGLSYLDATRMDAWERSLPPPFLRTHRSHIVNLRAARAIARRDGGWVIDLESTSVPISRSRLEAVRVALRELAEARALSGAASARRR
jgi:DNA-binding LytR/AlgR family response regulator